jgi:type IV pilus assembly protein PilP
MMRHVLILALVAGCGEPIPPSNDAAKKPAAKKVEELIAEPEPAGEGYFYNPAGKRDPFQSFLAQQRRSGETLGADAPPLQRYDVDKFALRGVIWQTSAPSALLIDPDGIGHVVHIGTYVGRNWGKVTSISEDGVVVTEEYLTLDGELVVNPNLPNDVSSSSGADVTAYKFTGKELDDRVGLYYYGARYYDPLLGRFITPDYVIPGGGLDPQGYNRYAYVLNNPMKYVDPDGRAPGGTQVVRFLSAKTGGFVTKTLASVIEARINQVLRAVAVEGKNAPPAIVAETRSGALAVQKGVGEYFGFASSQAQAGQGRAFVTGGGEFIGEVKFGSGGGRVNPNALYDRSRFAIVAGGQSEASDAVAEVSEGAAEAIVSVARENVLNGLSFFFPVRAITNSPTLSTALERVAAATDYFVTIPVSYALLQEGRFDPRAPAYTEY